MSEIPRGNAIETRQITDDFARRVASTLSEIVECHRLYKLKEGDVHDDPFRRAVLTRLDNVWRGADTSAFAGTVRVGDTFAGFDLAGHKWKVLTYGNDVPEKREYYVTKQQLEDLFGVEQTQGRQTAIGKIGNSVRRRLNPTLEERVRDLLRQVPDQLGQRSR